MIQLPMLRLGPKELEGAPFRDSCATVCIPALSTGADEGKQPRHSRKDQWANKTWQMLILQHCSALKGKRNSNPCHNRDEPWGHYGMHNKPITKRQKRTVPLVIPLVLKFIKTGNRMAVTRGWGQKDEECFNE